MLGKIRRATLVTKLLLPAVAALALVAAWAAIAPAQGEAPTTPGHVGLDPGTGEEVLFREIVQLTTEAVPGAKRDQPTQPSVVLRRGLSRGDTPATRELWKWHAQVRAGVAAARRDARLTLYDADGSRIVSWSLAGARPTKIQVGALKATGNEVAIETLELSAEGLDLDP